MGHKPTSEQDAILSAFPTGDDLVIEAGAGTGKTSTLKMLAEQSPRRRGLYLAYNRAIKDDASRTFPKSVTCMTSHGLAYRPVGAKYKTRLNGPRVPARSAARILKVNEPLKLGERFLQPTSIARIVLDTVSRFCHSADTVITARHVPVILGLEDRPSRDALAQTVLPYALKAWEDMTRLDGQLAYTHDTYLKMFQLTGPVLDCDYLLVDEAQDLNPVVQAIVSTQHAQVCFVGDRQQAIYAWRGAVDAMQTAAGKRLYLSQSFRFGPAIAAEANKWLAILGGDLRLSGFDQINSTVAPLDTPDAVLCRSNAAALGRVMRATERGTKVGLVGGGAEIKALARAAVDLMANRGTDHQELMAFTTWGEVQEYCENDSSGSDLKVLVTMVDRYGPDAIIATVDRLTDERYASLVVSTAHKAKGREWNRVQIADDFREPKATEDNPTPVIEPGEARLAYVAVTRAKQVLDRDGLSWVDGWVPRWAAVPEEHQRQTVSLSSSSVGAPEAAAVEQVTANIAPLTGKPEDQAGWEGYTADPCVRCGYLTDRTGHCDCAPIVEVAVVVPEPEAPCEGAPLPVGSMVAYHAARSASFRVVGAYPNHVLGWIYDLQEAARPAALHRGVSGDRLRPASLKTARVSR